MRRRCYRPLFPSALSEADFGASLSVVIDFALTTKLYIKIHMRNKSWIGGNFSSHQWGQWGAAGTRIWGYSIHNTGGPDGFPRLAVYPAGTDASLIGIQALEGFPANLFAPNADAWVACAVDLNVSGAGTTRQWQYWWSKRGIGNPIDNAEYWHDMGGIASEAGATSFFNGNDNLTSLGTVSSEVLEFYEMEIRETPQGPLLCKPDIGKLKGEYKGSFVGGSGPWNTYTDRRGVAWSIGPFNSMTRSRSPRPYAG